MAVREILRMGHPVLRQARAALRDASAWPRRCARSSTT